MRRSDGRDLDKGSPAKDYDQDYENSKDGIDGNGWDDV